MAKVSSTLKSLNANKGNLLHQKNVKPSLLIRCNDPRKFWWDVVILVLAIIICYLLPVEVAFEPPFAAETWYTTLDLVVNIVFGLDIVVNFNTSFYDPDGNEVFERKKIAINYMTKINFWIDIISTVPLGSSPFASICKCFKVQRITTLNKIIK
mmetsp:Transcript_33730/g.32766  ORF Transcript_33730/g.32766 Transcript_33730/m.32766 type:complete len:154 (+) Transcript_33730:166-627(+)